jgi:translocation and assembly module TamB
VKAGATPEQSGVTVNIDLGRRIKLQGETSSSGKASVGIGAEIEY